MDVTMFQMGFGESILIHQDDSCLLVDCGSESSKRQQYFNNVNKELDNYLHKALLVSHFHTDHINGIKYLSRENLHDFERIYLPHIFAADDYSVELLITEYLLEALLDRRRRSSQIWGCLIPMVEANRPVVLLRKGVSFHSAGCSFQTLWPPEISENSKNVWEAFVEEHSVLQLPRQAIHELAQKTRRVVQQIAGIADAPTQSETSGIELQALLQQFAVLRDGYIRTPWPNDVIALDIRKAAWAAYKAIKNKNETSIVFQTTDESKQQILMTGDVTQDIMEKVVAFDVSTIWPQKKQYDIIKVPHHGTERYYFDFSKYYNYRQLYISNGETTWSERRRGKISVKYFAVPHTSSIQCRNTQKRRCEYAMENGRCSNRCVECSVSDW